MSKKVTEKNLEKDIIETTSVNELEDTNAELIVLEEKEVTFGQKVKALPGKTKEFIKKNKKKVIAGVVVATVVGTTVVKSIIKAKAASNDVIDLDDEDFSELDNLDEDFESGEDIVEEE